MPGTDFVALPNPLWSCQLHILGGPRRMAVVATVYASVLVGLLLLFRMPFKDVPITGFAHEALKYLAGWHCLLVTLGGCAAISKALHRDHQTRMIESHRTSPMSGVTVALGYIIGPNLQILGILLVGAVVGVALVWIARDDMQLWIMSHVYLVMVVISVWSAAVFFGIGTSQRRSQFATVFGISAATIGAWLSIIPAFAVLSGMGSVLWCYGMLLAVPGIERGMGLVLGLALGMSLFWIGSAARRFRHPFQSALNPLSAAVLVTIWVIVSAIVTQVGPSNLGLLKNVFSLRIAVWCVPLSALCIAPLPFAMAAIQRRSAIQSRAGRPAQSAARCWRWAVIGVALFGLAELSVIGVSRVNPEVNRVVQGMDASAWQVLLVSGTLGIFTACAVLESALMLFGKFLLGFVAIISLWVFPPIVDFVRTSLFETTGPDLGVLSGCSPAGMIALMALRGSDHVWVGLLVQLSSAVVAMLGARLAVQTQSGLVPR